MWGKVVVAAIAVLLFVATELCFPIDGTNPVAVKQKHFWAIMLLIFSLVLGLPIEDSFTTQAKLEEVKQRIENHDTNSAKLEQFHELSDLYEISFAHAEPALKMWAD